MAPPHQNSLEDARRLLANCILIRGLQENGGFGCTAKRRDVPNLALRWNSFRMRRPVFRCERVGAGPIKTGAATHLRLLSFDRYRQPLRRCAAARANEGRPCVAQYPPRPTFGDVAHAAQARKRTTKHETRSASKCARPSRAR